MNPQIQTFQPQLQKIHPTFREQPPQDLQRIRAFSQIEPSNYGHNIQKFDAIHREIPISSTIIFSKPHGSTPPRKFLFQYFNPSNNLVVPQSPQVSALPFRHLSSSIMMPPVELNTPSSKADVKRGKESERENAGIVKPEYFAEMLLDTNWRGKRDENKYVGREDYERLVRKCASLQQKIREQEREMQGAIRIPELNGKKTLQDENKELKASFKTLLAGFDLYRISLLKECRLLVDRYRLTCTEREPRRNRQS